MNRQERRTRAALARSKTAPPIAIPKRKGYVPRPQDVGGNRCVPLDIERKGSIPVHNLAAAT